MAADDVEDTVRILANHGTHHHIERCRGGKIESGILVSQEQGKPIPPGAEYLELEKRDNEPGVYDVTLSHKGPARVSSTSFREGHQRIFGTKPDKNYLN